ncbi:hypothetical protein, partial [Sphingomonas parapaucimobilis]|uniref:hypothetical protein n=1 Tax=Sphingomonas parapaucimobilis TaxID=28213 RepID=UPI001427A1FF
MQQAICAHSAAVARASLENSPSFSATRRGILAGLAAIPAMSAHARAINASGAREWDRLVVAYEKADRESDCYQEEVCKPVFNRLE